MMLRTSGGPRTSPAPASQLPPTTGYRAATIPGETWIYSVTLPNTCDLGRLSLIAIRHIDPLV